MLPSALEFKDSVIFADAVAASIDRGSYECSLDHDSPTCPAGGMAGRDDRHLSMRARNATTRLTEYTATRVRYKARYIRKSSHTVRSGSSVH